MAMPKTTLPIIQRTKLDKRLSPICRSYVFWDDYFVLYLVFGSLDRPANSNCLRTDVNEDNSLEM